MVITGIFDRVLRVSPTGLIGMPIWTGLLIMINAGLGVVVGTKMNPNTPLATTYRSLNVFCSFLCTFLVGLYGSWVISFTASAYDGPVVDHSNVAVVAIIFVMALIEVFLAIMGTFASNERNSTYMQLADPPIAPYNDQAGMYVPLNQVPRSNFSRAGQMQGSFQPQAVPTAYQPIPQAVVQGGSPVMMAPVSMNQMGTARAPVMLMPVQTMQQMPGTSGNSNGLMFVQVPYGSTQENTSSQPQGTINPSGPQLSEDLQGTA